ncbi:MAG: hypothetical protein AAF750_05880 [Planctomycetota bacterium]
MRSRRQTADSLRRLREAGRVVLVVALVFAAAVATSPVMVSVELLRVVPWAVSEAGGMLGIGGSGGVEDGLETINPDLIFLCAGHGCGCRSAKDTATSCCCYPTAEMRMKRAKALVAAERASGVCGAPKLGTEPVDQPVAKAEREMPLDGPGWRALGCRGVEGLLLGVDVRHWQPSEGGAWYPLSGLVERVAARSSVRVVNDALAVDAPPPEWV